MKPIRFFLKSISLLWIGSIAAAGFALLTQVILARSLGPKEFGDFAATLATVTIFTPLAGFGVHSMLLKVYGQEGWSAQRWLKPVFGYSLITSLAAVILIIAMSIVNSSSSESHRVLLLLTPIIASQAAINLVGSKLQLEERYFSLSFWQLSMPAFRLIGVAIAALLLSSSFSVEVAAIIFCMSSVMFLCISFLSLKKMQTSAFNLIGHASSEQVAQITPVGSVKEVAKQSWGFGLSGILYLIYYQSDIVLLKHLSGPEAAGIYNVAYLIIGATYLFPGVVFQKYLLPRLHRWASSDFLKLTDIYKKGSFMMLLSGILAGILIVLATPYFVPIVFGEEYTESIGVVTILSICIPIRFFSSSADAVLTSGKELNKKIKIQTFVAAINIILNLIFIPLYGLWAAAYITVFSEFLMSAAMHFYAYKYLSPQMSKTAKKVAG